MVLGIFDWYYCQLLGGPFLNNALVGGATSMVVLSDCVDVTKTKLF